ncbi:MAG: hypothetical protein SGJ27_23325 [Candidatus Melainabacteria bacterium]|nr:hypothetical protein [Candidatus Melainabacteria bacterium]
MVNNRGEHPTGADSDDDDVTPKPKPRRGASDSPGVQPGRKNPSLANRGTDTGIVPAGKTLFFDLNFNIAAALCYFPFAPGAASVLWLATEKNNNQYLKFHAVQSLVVTVGLISFHVLAGTINAILGIIPVIGPAIGLVFMLFQALVGVVFLGLMFRMAYSVYNGKDGRLPVVANLSDRIMESYF